MSSTYDVTNHMCPEELTLSSASSVALSRLSPALWLRKNTSGLQKYFENIITNNTFDIRVFD